MDCSFPRGPQALAAAIRRRGTAPISPQVGEAARATIAARVTTEAMIERIERVYTSLGLGKLAKETCDPRVSAKLLPYFLAACFQATASRSRVNRPVVLVLGPHREAISGVSTH